MVDRAYGRRSVLRAGAVGLGVPTLCGERAVADSRPDEAAPPVAWKRSYPGDERAYEHVPTMMRQTADEGYVIGGTGAPIRSTGPEGTQFSCLKTDAAGEAQWIAFGLDDHELELSATTDVIQRSGGGFALVGDGRYDESDEERWGQHVARAITFAPDGQVDWTAIFDPFAEDEDEAVSVDESVRFEALTRSAAGGGPLAVGDHGRDAWAVKFAADGAVDWQHVFGDALQFAHAFTTSSGYLLWAIREDERAVLHLDRTGAIDREVLLDIDYDRIPHDHVLEPTDDGGYAITGRYDDRTRMVIQKFDATGAAEWLETYNGPYDGNDWAFDIEQTDDGGFALFGRMQAAATGDSTPAVVKTAPDGTTEWQTLLEEEPRASYAVGQQTSDGGYAAFRTGPDNVLVKYEGDASSTEPDAGDRTGDDGDGEATADQEDEDDSEGETGSTDGTDAADDTADPTGEEPGEGEAGGGDEHQASDAGATDAGSEDRADDENGTDGAAAEDATSAAEGDGSTAESDDDPEDSPADLGELPGFGLGAGIASIGGAAAYLLSGGRPGVDDGSAGGTAGEDHQPGQ